MGRSDSTDRIIEEWARFRREVIGVKTPLQASAYIGPVRCTLAERRDLHSGSRSAGKFDQHWPEVYPPGNPSLVNWLFWRASPPIKEILDRHYVLPGPRNKTLRAELMGLSRRVYWDRVARAKAYVEGGLALAESVRTLSPGNGVSFATTEIPLVRKSLP